MLSRLIAHRMSAAKSGLFASFGITASSFFTQVRIGKLECCLQPASWQWKMPTFRIFPLIAGVAEFLADSQLAGSKV